MHGRFAMQPGLQLFVLWTFLQGGGLLWLGIAVYAALFLLLDDLGGNDIDISPTPRASVLNIFLYASFVLTWVLTFILIYLAGDFGLGGIETTLGSLAGIDIADARARTNGLDLAGGAVVLGIVYSAAAGNSGHELVHRRDRPLDREMGHWLLALVLDGALAVEHIFGHHRHVGLARDPATAARGVSFWRFLPRHVVGANVNAMRHEAERLGRRRRWNPRHNMVLRGYLISILIAVAWVVGAGATGLALFAVSAATGRLIVELFHYCSHYGLVRVPGRPVRPRHSWNSFRRLSTSLMLNSPRHASHHKSARRAFWRLTGENNAPELPHGIALMAAIATLPPLWFQVMAPAIAEWDRAFASDGEKLLISVGSTNE